MTTYTVTLRNLSPDQVMALLEINRGAAGMQVKEETNGTRKRRIPCKVCNKLIDPRGMGPHMRTHT